jgi:hypothetical protein
VHTLLLQQRVELGTGLAAPKRHGLLQGIVGHTQGLVLVYPHLMLHPLFLGFKDLTL